MRLFLPALLIAVTLAAPAVAQDTRDRVAIPVPAGAPPRPGQPRATIMAEPVALMIAACDADSDARVTRAELQACVARSFAGVDGAASGRIGYIAYSDWALKWLGDRNALPSPFTVDADGDDKITLAELQAQFATLFARFDGDRDGVLTRAELLTIHTGIDAAQDRGKRKR